MMPETMMFDYPTLRVIWWLLLGVLLTGFAVMDGFDMGVGALLPFLGKTDDERRQMLNAVGPVWEGNQVWLLLGAGAIFAAFPPAYALAFSGFYLAMLVVLLSLIVRPVGFKFRSKIDHPRWRNVWDWCLFASGFVPALVFGVAVGNLLSGVPFHYTDDVRIVYDGNGLTELLHPFALVCGLVSLSMLVGHGAVYTAIKTEGALHHRARAVAVLAPVVALALFALAGFWLAFTNGYAITGGADIAGPTTPFAKSVAVVKGGWLHNYRALPIIMIVPVLAYLAGLVTILLVRKGRVATAFISSGLMLASIIATAGISLFPFLIPSTTHPDLSLTIWDATSSRNTLFIMLIAALIFVPIVLSYTAWVYSVLRGKVTAAYIRENSKELY